MQKLIAASLFVAGLVTVGVLAGTQWLSGTETPTLTWDEHQEVAVAEGDPVEAATGDREPADLLRQELATADLADADGDRTPLLLRGRLIDRFHRPVDAASVFLDFGRGGPRGGGNQRRVPDPVRSDADGRFAFQGQTFRNLRVTLLATHPLHAPSYFERNLGDVVAEMDLGELTVSDGGELVGRVTDLDGNGIPAAEVKLLAENDNRMRFRREQNQLPSIATDNNGYYRLTHVATGDWRVAATAPHHQSANSDVVAVGETQQLEVADIRLGPGYELAGIVSDAAGKPVEGAEVIARAQWQPGNGDGGGGGNGNGGGGRRGGRGPGGPGGFGGQGFGGQEHRTRSDTAGKFFLEHLPGTLLDLAVRKDGYLNYEQRGVDAKTGTRVYITLQDGLAIAGTVLDSKLQSPVTRFQVTAERVRGLSTPQLDGGIDIAEAMRQMRDGNLDNATREQLRTRMEDARRQFGDSGNGRPGRDNGGPGGGPGGGRGPRGRREQEHKDGHFRETGLQEGVYVVVVESNAHAMFRSAEVELRLGAPAPELTIALDKGYSIRGIVRNSNGEPIANATVELRAAETDEQNGNANQNGGRRRGPGGGGPGGRGLRQMLGGNGGGAAASATTGKDGTFAIEHANIGRYRLQASAHGHDDARTEPFALAADVAGVELQLGSLGSLSGRVVGATAAQLAEVRVVAVPVGDGANIGMMFRGNGRPFASVTQDGRYRFDELAPGDYAVRAFLGNGMRELFAQWNGGAIAADVSIRAGQAATFDVGLLQSQAGSVRGSVLHNGQPASGFQVTLRRTDDNGGGGGGRRGGFGFGRDFSATVDAQGRFEIGDVAEGQYELSISGARRSGTLHNETVVVRALTAAEVTVSLSTAAIDGTVTTSDNIAPADLDGSVMLLAGATEIPADIGEQRRNGNTLRARVQDGAFTFEMVPPGNYLAVLSIRGRERSATQVTATIGQRVRVALPVGAVAATPTGAPNGNGTNPGQAGFDDFGPRGNQTRGGGGGGGGGARDANAPRQGSPADAGGQRRPRRGN